MRAANADRVESFGARISTAFVESTVNQVISIAPIGADLRGFDDWLAASGFTQGSRKLSINLLPIVDKNLRRRGVDEVAKLNHAVLDDCCRALKKKYFFRAGTIHTLERYLVANRLIVDGRQAAATQPSSLSGEYAGHLREVGLKVAEAGKTAS